MLTRASLRTVYHVLVTEQIDTVMHFAASTHVDNSFGNSLAFTANNVAGTHTLLEASRACGSQIRRFVHVSTDEVYGENMSYDDMSDVNQEDSAALSPTNPYAASKAAAEMLVQAYARSYGLPTVITRGNNVFGPMQFPEKLIPKIITMASRGLKLPVHGSGVNKRSYLYVEDVAEAFDVVLHRAKTGSTINIGTTAEQTVLEVVQSIVRLMCPYADPADMIEFVEDRAFNDMRYFLETSALSELGWQQRTPFEEGLKKTIDWYMSRPAQDHWGIGGVERVLVAHPRLPGAAAEDESAATMKQRELKLIMSSGHLSDLGGRSTADIDDPDNADSVTRAAGASARAADEDGPKFLVFGRTGWIGGMLGRLLEEEGVAYQYAASRLENPADVAAEIARSGCTHVLNAAGLTGRPNVDWCETHKGDVIKVNVVGTLALADACRRAGVHLTIFATGCIFHYDEQHPQDVERDPETLVAKDASLTFSEEDEANFSGSFYSLTKGYVEQMLRSYSNVLTLRVRMPIDGDITSNKRNFIYKIAHYPKVVDIPNSMTCLPELLPYALALAQSGRTGVWNFTNPGAISHGQVLELYRDFVDPSFSWTVFSVDEQAKVIKAGRSNNELDASKLWAEFPGMLPIRQSLLEHVFKPFAVAQEGSSKQSPSLAMSAAAAPARTCEAPVCGVARGHVAESPDAGSAAGGRAPSNNASSAVAAAF